MIPAALALIVADDGKGRVEMIDPFKPATIRVLVGGDYDVINGKLGQDQWLAYSDENGKANKLRYNAAASGLAHAIGWRDRIDYLVGTVVFVGITRSGPGMLETHVPASVLTAAQSRGIIPASQP